MWKALYFIIMVGLVAFFAGCSDDESTGKSVPNVVEPLN